MAARRPGCTRPRDSAWDSTNGPGLEEGGGVGLTRPEGDAVDSGVLVDIGAVSEGVGEAGWNEPWGVTVEPSAAAGVGVFMVVGPGSAPQANAKPRIRLAMKKHRIIQKHLRTQRPHRDPTSWPRGAAECSRAWQVSQRGPKGVAFVTHEHSIPPVVRSVHRVRELILAWPHWLEHKKPGPSLVFALARRFR